MIPSDYPTRNAFVEAWLARYDPVRLAVGTYPAAVRDCYKRKLDNDDVKAVCAMAVVIAADSYNPAKGAFSTWASRVMRWQLQQTARRAGGREMTIDRPSAKVGVWRGGTVGRWSEVTKTETQVAAADEAAAVVAAFDAAPLAPHHRELARRVWGLDGEPQPIRDAAAAVGVDYGLAKQAMQWVKKLVRRQMGRDRDGETATDYKSNSYGESR